MASFTRYDAVERYSRRAPAGGRLAVKFEGQSAEGHPPVFTLMLEPSANPVAIGAIGVAELHVEVALFGQNDRVVKENEDERE